MFMKAIKSISLDSRFVAFENTGWSITLLLWLWITSDIKSCLVCDTFVTHFMAVIYVWRTSTPSIRCGMGDVRLALGTLGIAYVFHAMYYTWQFLWVYTKLCIIIIFWTLPTPDVHLPSSKVALPLLCVVEEFWTLGKPSLQLELRGAMILSLLVLKLPPQHCNINCLSTDWEKLNAAKCKATNSRYPDRGWQFFHVSLYTLQLPVILHVKLITYHGISALMLQH